MARRIDRWAALAVGVAAFAGTTELALAQTAARIRGTIESVGADRLTVRERDGRDVSLPLTADTPVRAVVKASLADIKPGTFIGAAATPMPDGTQRALAISLLPESSRATGGNFSPWDLTPESTMINASVSDRVAEVGTDRLTLTYKDGQKTLLLGPDTPVVGFAPATRADMKPGTRVVAFVSREADGTTMVRNVVIGRDGVDPPM